MRWAVGGLMSIAACFAIHGYASLISVSRLRREVVQARRCFCPYRLEEPIGIGGMATVYHAEHALLPRPVAVKVLRNSVVSPEELARFERDVELVSKLHHPNTIQIFGKTGDGAPYYAMELVPGITLSTL